MGIISVTSRGDVRVKIELRNTLWTVKSSIHIEMGYYCLLLCACEEEGIGDSVSFQLGLEGNVIWLPFSPLRFLSNLSIFTGLLLPCDPHYTACGEPWGQEKANICLDVMYRQLVAPRLTFGIPR